MKWILLAWMLLLAGVACIAHAQVPMTGAGNGAPGGAFVGPIDINGSAYAFWSMRPGSAALAAAGQKLFNVCDAATGATCADATATSSGGVSIPLIGGSSCSSISCVIATFYDQSGGENCSGPCDLVQTTNADRAALTVSCQNSKPCAVSSGTPICYKSASASGAGGAVPYTVSGSFKITTNVSEDVIWSAGSNVLFGAGGSGVIAFGAGAWYSLSGSGTDNNFHAVQVLAKTGTGTASIEIDGTTSSGTSGTSSLGGNTLGIFADQCAAFYLAANFLEVGIWASDQSANFATLNANQRAYWSF